MTAAPAEKQHIVVPDTNYAAIVATVKNGQECLHETIKFTVVAANTLHELAERVENLERYGKKICSVTAFNLREPLPREQFLGAEELRRKLEKLEKLAELGGLAEAEEAQG